MPYNALGRDVRWKDGQLVFPWSGALWAQNIPHTAPLTYPWLEWFADHTGLSLWAS